MLFDEETGGWEGHDALPTGLMGLADTTWMLRIPSYIHVRGQLFQLPMSRVMVEAAESTGGMTAMKGRLDLGQEADWSAAKSSAVLK